LFLALIFSIPEAGYLNEKRASILVIIEPETAI
jgi:hypothetical protein